MMVPFSGMVMVIILMNGMMMTMKEEEEGVDRWELSLAGAESQAPALALPLCLPHHLCSTLPLLLLLFSRSAVLCSGSFITFALL